MLTLNGLWKRRTHPKTLPSGVDFSQMQRNITYAAELFTLLDQANIDLSELGREMQLSKQRVSQIRQELLKGESPHLLGRIEDALIKVADAKSQFYKQVHRSLYALTTKRK
jgi:hypothetical protein